MTFEEFEKATASTLRETAKARFDRRDWDHMSGDVVIGNLLEAQFYMAELDRRHDAKIARRDFRMELIVIGLIAFELIAATWGMYLSAKESREQAQAMERIVNSLDKVEKAARQAGQLHLIH